MPGFEARHKKSRGVAERSRGRRPGPEPPAFPCLIQAKALPSSPPSHALRLSARAGPCSKTRSYGFEPQNL